MFYHTSHSSVLNSLPSITQHIFRLASTLEPEPEFSFATFVIIYQNTPCHIPYFFQCAFLSHNSLKFQDQIYKTMFMLFTHIAESSADFDIVILKHHFIFRLSFVPAILYERILLQNYVYDVYRLLGCDVMSLTETYQCFGRTYCLHLVGRCKPGNVDRGLVPNKSVNFSVSTSPHPRR